jgi:hypothetical protein
MRHTIATAALVGLVCGCNSKSPLQPTSHGASGSTASDIGFVLEVKGDWRLQDRNDTPITAGDILPAEGIVSRIGDSHDGSAVMVSLCTGEVKTYRDTPFKLPKRVDSALVNRLWSLASRRYHGDLVSVQSRGGQAKGTLRDDAVRLQNGELDLAPVFEAMPPGKYRLRLEPIPDSTEHDATPVIVSELYEWSPSTQPTLKVASPLRGAYELQAVQVDTASPEAASLVVICTRSECDRLAKDLRAARELVSSWGQATSPEVKRRFLQATLASLATEIEPSHPEK